MVSSRFTLYWHTLRHLRWEQVWFRIWRRFWRPRLTMRAELAQTRRTQAWPLPAWRKPSMLDAATFRFLGVQHLLASASDWNTVTDDKLWLYNLHYFDDLNALNSAVRSVWHQQLIARWISENPPLQGNGWEPYPLSLRIVNWIVWDLAGTSLSREARSSLQLQARALRAQLEFHLLGNHLWANAKALIFAGTYFEGGEADEWLATGLHLIERELSEQVLPDGGHFELSPMYHAIVTDDLVEMVALALCIPGRIRGEHMGRWEARIRLMLDWFDAMTHPDGEMAAFNDCAQGIAPRLADIAIRAKALDIEWMAPNAKTLRPLLQSGYVRVDRGPGSLICDVGHIGPDYLPGHAHADTLSFEFSLFGDRLVVDPGTSTYATTAERLRQRGTAAHNTVAIDGENSSEVWSSFRVGRRAKPTQVEWQDDGLATLIQGSHDGYQRLPGRVNHLRRWRIGDGELCITDTVTGSYSMVECGLLLHPKWDATKDGDTVLLVNGDNRARLTAESAKLKLVSATWAASFGDERQAVRVQVEPQGASWSVRLTW